MNTEEQRDLLREVEDLKDFLRQSRRRDGKGPHPHYFTGNLEIVHHDEGEGLMAAMADHPSPVVAYVGVHGVHWRQEQIDLYHTPLGNQSCYGNARLVAKAIGGKYVEGFARHHMLPPDSFVHHAWVLTPDGDPMEVTWDHTSSDYVGVVFKKRPPMNGWSIITDKWAAHRLGPLTA